MINITRIFLLFGAFFVKFTGVKSDVRRGRQGLLCDRTDNLSDMHSMRKCLKRMSWVGAIFVALVSWCAPTVDASVHTYDVGDLVDGDDGTMYTASWLHDASMGSSGDSANRAYRSGYLSKRINGSLSGDFNEIDNTLKDISGTLIGTLGMLPAGTFVGNESFELRLGRAVGATSNGALKFNTSGTGIGDFTGGFIDYDLRVDNDSVLSGTFFFKPQAETGSTALSPNRGDAQAFTLWGYDYMHSSGPVGGGTDTVNWLEFLDDLGYSGDALVNRGESNLGIALFASDPEPPIHNSANPEPTTLLVWAGLVMIGLGYGRRIR